MPSTANTLPSKIDFERFVAVVMDVDGLPTVVEFDAHASEAKIARCLCDNDGLPDCDVIRIVEFFPSEAKSKDVTEDVARLIPAISETAMCEGWTIRSCARDLMERFGIDDPANVDASVSDFCAKAQVGFDLERDRRAMA
jgi:hypothetical protein